MDSFTEKPKSQQNKLSITDLLQLGTNELLCLIFQLYIITFYKFVLYMPFSH